MAVIARQSPKIQLSCLFLRRWWSQDWPGWRRCFFVAMSFHDYPKTAINFAFLTYKEALKLCNADLHGSSLANRDLGFRP